MTKSVVLGISALAGAVFFTIAADAITLLGGLMGAILGTTIAIAVFAFPLDLDYRERRVWPPKAP